MLAKYRQYLTKRLGKGTQFVYEFKIEGNMQHSASSRPVPFAIRNQVREQIQAMLKDVILEESDFAYINQITLVIREGKAVLICFDARRINKQFQTARKFCQCVNFANILRCQIYYESGPKQCSSTGTVPLEQSFRQWAAFQLESNVYQFTTVPYGFKNSSAAFIRALEEVLGECGLKKICLCT